MDIVDWTILATIGIIGAAWIIKAKDHFQKRKQDRFRREKEDELRF